MNKYGGLPWSLERAWAALALCAALGSAGCGSEVVDSAPDGALPDAGRLDSGPVDAGPPVCDGGCLVGATCFPAGTLDLTNPCSVCDPERSTTAFSANDGATCDDGQFCTEGDVCSAGTCRGEERSCDDGIACNGDEVCDNASSACESGTATCAGGEICDALSGDCVLECSGCLVDGVCYGEGQVGLTDPCLVCRVADSRSTLSANDGASCDDGEFCTMDDVCSAGVCGGGPARDCDDGVACDGVETCDEGANACAPGAPTCGASEVCDVSTDACIATCTGCVIGGACFGAGQRNPTNPCEVCDVARSASAWSPDTGAACDDGLYCTVGDQCSAAGVCSSGSARSCGDSIACNGIETCNEVTDRCDAGATTCTGGRSCDPGTDSCVLRCVGGTTLCGTTCVDTSYDPANCGACGNICASGSNASTACVSSACRTFCDAGFGDCSAAVAGCETNTENDEANCGACGNACGVGSVCDSGACVRAQQSCRAWLAALPGAPSGTYAIDPDGDGPGARFDAYCDMTTAGGGWTLTYKVRNDIPSGSNPWWNQVLPGAGTTFPTALTRPAGVFEGPAAATRAALFTSVGATEWRATTMRDATSEVLHDFRSSYAGATGRSMRCFATGTCSTAEQTCSTSSTDAVVITNAIGGAVAAGNTGYICDIGWTDCSFCVDWSHVSPAPDESGTSRYVGDSSIGRTDTTTYYWVR